MSENPYFTTTQAGELIDLFPTYMAALLDAQASHEPLMIWAQEGPGVDPVCVYGQIYEADWQAWMRAVEERSQTIAAP